MTVGQALGLATAVIICLATRKAQVWAVQTGSMIPTFRPGDAVIVHSVQPPLRPGDIISYHSQLDPTVIVSHRLLATTPRLITKGDNLSEPDPPVPREAVAGKVTHVLPKGGYALSFLYSWPGLISCIYLPATALMFLESRRLISETHRSYYCHVNYIKPKPFLLKLLIP